MKHFAHRHLIALVALCACVAACQKDPQTDTDINQFVGEYSLTIVQEPVEDIPVKADNWVGTLTITPCEDPEVVDVIGTVNMSGTNVDLYHTLGSLDSEGRLVLQTSTFTNPNNGLVATIDYRPIDPADVLKWDATLSATLQGYALTYILHNTATLNQ